MQSVQSVDVRGVSKSVLEAHESCDTPLGRACLALAAERIAINYQPVFVIDIDSVLLRFNEEVAAYFSRVYGVAFPLPKHWEYEHAYGIPKVVVKEMWQHIHKRPIEAYNGARHFLKQLRTQCVVIALTSRNWPDSMKACTADLWRTKLRPELDDVLFLEEGKTKGDELKALNADFFLDDSLANIYDAAEKSPETKCLLMNQPWNRSLDIDPPYTRVRSYAAVLSEVERG